MLDEDFKNLRRSAIVIKPAQPFLDWLQKHDPEMIIYDDMQQGDIYLLPDLETIEQIEKWLKKNFDELFAEQLFNWYVDETMWPENRTFKMFKEWFQYSLHTMVFDTQQGMIEKI
jgi:hypothetical protein